VTGLDGLGGVGLPDRMPRLLGDGALQPEDPTPVASTTGFAAVLERTVGDVARLQRDAHEQAMGLVRGEPLHVHDVLVAMGKAEVAFNLALEVRNRLVQAWETLSRSVL
jgi:flagellar hook-basal body complex protein FliE